MHSLSRIGFCFMKNFATEFHTLNYVIKESDDILLFAHSRPDGDTAGSVFALKEYIKSLGKNVDAACFDPLPEYLHPLTPERFQSPSDLDLGKYKLIIACDSVERGFEKIAGQLRPDQIVALLDHHVSITMKKDINIIDPEASAVCELVYDFFVSSKIGINRNMATYLMLGILGDTGVFQHANTTPHVMEISISVAVMFNVLPFTSNSRFSNAG